MVNTMKLPPVHLPPSVFGPTRLPPIVRTPPIPRIPPIVRALGVGGVAVAPALPVVGAAVAVCALAAWIFGSKGRRA